MRHTADIPIPQNDSKPNGLPPSVGGRASTRPHAADRYGGTGSALSHSAFCSPPPFGFSTQRPPPPRARPHSGAHLRHRAASGTPPARPHSALVRRSCLESRSSREEPLVRLFAGRGYRPAFPSGWPLSPRPPPLPEPQPPCHPPRRGMSGPRPRGGLHFSRGGGALWGLFRSGSPFCRVGRATRTRPGLLSPAQRGPDACSPFVDCSPVRRAPQAQALFRAASCGALSPRCALRPWA
jgi:hypothetical protein